MAAAKNKSVLDGVRVVCDTCGRTKEEHNVAFPCHPTRQGWPSNDPARVGSSPKSQLEIVGHCPHCGSPCYGRKKITADELPVTVFSCQCHHSSSLLSDLTKTK